MSRPRNGEMAWLIAIDKGMLRPGEGYETSQFAVHGVGTDGNRMPTERVREIQEALRRTGVNATLESDNQIAVSYTHLTLPTICSV